MSQRRIYLDHAATTPLHPAAREAIARALESWHNPSSPHAEGRAARASLEQARRRIAAALGWTGEIIFTSGASEALAIALQRAQAGPRFVSSVEHDAVFRSAPDARRLLVRSDGIVVLDAIEGERPLVAIQHANNETGVLQPLAEVADAVREKGGLLLADCAQTAGKYDLPDADFIPISGHKLGGPPGIGALLVRDFGLLAPVGGQEHGYRFGTENLPGVLGMAAALEADRGWLQDAVRLRSLLEEGIVALGGEIVARDAPRVATIGAYRMPGVPSKAQLIQFDLAGISVSAGSACSSGSLKPSQVLAAMGWDESAAGEVVRVSFGRDTCDADIERFLAAWSDLSARRRAA